MNTKRSLFAILLSLLALPAAGAPPVGEPELVRDIRPGVQPSIPVEYTRVGDLAYFLGSLEGYPGPSLFRTDGTAAGTFMISAMPGEVWQTPGSPLAYFVAPEAPLDENVRLWRSDGTQAGTFPVSPELLYEFSTPGPLQAWVPETGLLFFAADQAGPERNEELWVSDGTAAGTRMVADLNPEGGSRPGSLFSLGGRVYFLAGDAVGHYRELWTSDGTAAGTFRVKDLQTGDDQVRMLKRVGDRLVFFVATPEGGVEIWRSDGTEAGTVRETAIPAPAGVRYFFGTVSGSRLFFAVYRETFDPSELWVTDGTAAGTVRLVQGVTGEANLYWELALEPAGDGIFFELHDPEHGQEPWWSDGTPAGTRRIADLCPGTCSSSPLYLATYGSRVFFSAVDGTVGREPWITDGTSATRLGDLCPGSCSSHPVGAREAEGVLFFGVLDSPDGQEVWATDGTPAGTRAVTAFARDEIFYFSTLLGTGLPGRLVFTADDGVHGSEMWTLLVGDGPPPPSTEWLTTASIPGFRFQVRIGGAAGTLEPACMAQTLCVNGALPGRPEVFVRASGPVQIVTLSTSQVEVWAEQVGTGEVRYYQLNAPGPADSTLPGLLDTDAFPAASAAARARPKPPAPPKGDWADGGSFRVKARVVAAKPRNLRKSASCAPDTLCLGGGAPEVLVRIAGPRPNGYLWPMLARFTASAVEVWIQQKKTGTVRYYRLEPATGSDLDGIFDRKGFKP